MMQRLAKVTGSLEGVVLDKDFGYVLSGWAIDDDDAGGKVAITVVADGQCITASTARYFRPDLVERDGVECGNGAGFHGFSLLIPTGCAPGPQALTVHVLANGKPLGVATLALPGSGRADPVVLGGRSLATVGYAEAGIAPDDWPLDMVGDVVMLRGGGVFDIRWYERAYPDVTEWCRGMGASPHFHYLLFGRAQGRFPHVPMHGDWYLKRYGALIDRMGTIGKAMGGSIVARSVADHYYTAGGLFGFDAVPGFDEQTYLGLNPDVRKSVQQGHMISGYRHYLMFGAADRRLAAPGIALPPRPVHQLLSSSEFMALLDADKGLSGPAGWDWRAINARRFAGEEVPPNRFAETLYRAHRPDVADGIAAGHLASGAAHWRDYGLAEDLAGTTPRLDGYCEHRYLTANPDVAEAVSCGAVPSGYHHFLVYGHAEGRRGGPGAGAGHGATVGAPLPRTVPVADILKRIATRDGWPTISVVMPVYETPERWLRAAVDSVLAQIYPFWELCIVDDASPDPRVSRLLEAFAARDRRIRVVRRSANGGIAAASNTALSMARGGWIALLDHDDQLTADALYEVAAAIVEHEPDAVYSDEDKMDVDGRLYDATHKPGWSPDLLRGTMYVGHLACYRTSVVRAVGGFRSACDGTQDYDLALRVAGVTDRFVHVPKILYHWVAIPGSAAAALSAKSHAVERQKTAIAEAVAPRAATPFAVHSHWRAGNWRVVYAPPSPAPLVSVVIPSAGRMGEVCGRRVDLLKNCVMSLLGAEGCEDGYGNVEIIVVHNGELDAATLSFLRALPNARAFHCRRPDFNFSERVNLGVEQARGDYVLLLNDDTQVVAPRFLSDMVGLASQPGVGVVGPRLLFANGSIQHVGTLLLNGVPTHALIGEQRLTPGPQGIAQLTHNAVAATAACLLVSRRLYREVGGFDPGFPVNYNDVDFCNKIRAKGLRVVIDPGVELYHFESQSKEGTFDWELRAFLQRWGRAADPYVNQNFSASGPFYQIARPLAAGVAACLGGG